MITILDASAGIEVVLDRSGAAPIKKILRKSDQVLAPELYASEITNVFWKYRLHGSIEKETCKQGVSFALRLPDCLLPCAPLAIEAFDLAVQARMAAYDMFYIALARRYQAHLVTLDRTLLKAAKQVGVKVWED